MLVRFWGTRGSLPAPLDAQRVSAKVRAALRAARSEQLIGDAQIDAFIERLPFAVSGTFGGDSSCVEIETGGSERLIFDAGSGLRVFGNAMLAKHGGVPQTYNVFMSHLHWDHIMGFPFFTPAYIPGNRLRIYGCHENIREALERQHGPPSFPVTFDVLGAEIEFVHLEPGRRYDLPDGGTISTLKQRHGGDSFGYRYERDGKTVVYSTDSEHKLELPDETKPFVEFFDRADLVIFDAMYSLGDAASLKEDWGHSSNVVGVDLARHAFAKHLVLFHHEPAHDDAQIERILAETRRYEEIGRDGDALEITAAYDGLEIPL